jgi:hypothetical protein
VAAVALVIQFVSATWWNQPYRMPNLSLVIAYNLATSGRYEGGNWVRLKGQDVPGDPPVRSYLLPGEPVYLASGLALHRPQVFSYWHVPVAVVLVVAASASALALFGADAALLVGILAALDPFIVIHGRVYDDTFLAAALFWLITAIALHRFVDAGSAPDPARWRPSLVGTAVLLIASGWAAVTRPETRVAVIAVAICCVAVPGLRRLRSTGFALAVGVVLAVSAWAGRNVIVQKHFMTGSTHDGLTLWESNAPSAMRALALGQVDALSTDPSIVGAIWQQTAHKDEVGANQVFMHAAIQEMWSNPLRVAALGVRKVVLSVAGVRPEMPIDAARNVVSVLSTLLLACLAAFGAVRISRRAPNRNALRHLAGVAACLLGLEVLGVLALGPVGLRYWILWRPVLWIMASQAVRPAVQPFSTSAHPLRRTPSSCAVGPRSGGRGH